MDREEIILRMQAKIIVWKQRAYVWKRAAKKWRHRYLSMDNYLEMYINVEGDASRRLELLEKALPYLIDYLHIFEGDTIEDLNMLAYFIEDIAKELENETSN